MIPDLRIEDYDYDLDSGRIAKYPLKERDASKLLVYKPAVAATNCETAGNANKEESSRPTPIYADTKEVDKNCATVKGGLYKCSDHHFYDLPNLLPSDTLMVFNDTKVVPARMFFQRPTGAHIEIFCLEPVSPPEYERNFASTDSCTWKCIVGNAKRWKNDVLHLCEPHENPTLDGAAAPHFGENSSEEDGAAAPHLSGNSSEADGAAAPHLSGNSSESDAGSNPASRDEVSALNMTATLVERTGETATVRFDWEGGLPFSTVLEICGRVPIPPYLNRETEAIDKDRYQTLYAKYRGSVAAPTAGLHFTDRVLTDIRDRGIKMANVCLHVGAGTFLPVKEGRVAKHNMHSEPFSVTRELLTNLLEAKKAKRPITAVGTTSVRTLESLYYVGAKCIENGSPSDVEQWEPYEREWEYTAEETLEAIISYMDRTNTENMTLQDSNSVPTKTDHTQKTENTETPCETDVEKNTDKKNTITLGTRIIIVPGFDFKFTDVLVTNFHQPQSTLLLLISAFLGGEWRPLYDHALKNGYRFLSYGDSSLLFRSIR